MCHVYFNRNQDKVLAQYSQVQGLKILPAFAYFDFSGNFDGQIVLKINQISNEDEPYQIMPSGVVTISTNHIFVAINYTINETTPGANVNGNRRMALCRIDYSSATLTLNICRYYQVETDWTRIKQIGSVLSVF